MLDAVSSLGRTTRSLAHLRGARVVLEPWIRAFGRSSREVEVQDFDGDLRLRLRLNEHMESRIFWFGSYSRDVLCVLGRIVRNGDVVIDVGANIGEISLFCAKRVGPEGRVFAVEPFAPIARRLAWHVGANEFRNVEVIERAIGRCEGTVGLFGTRQRSPDGLYNSGLNTMFRSPQRDVPLDSVAQTTLDRLVRERSLSRVDGLKIDIEGGEMDALVGAREVLTSLRPWIVLEANGQACHDAGYGARDLLVYLRDLGYGFERIGRLGALSAMEPTDVADFQNVLCRPSGQ